MKTVLSSIVAALVALSFAGIVCAAEPAPAAMPAGHPAIAAPAADAKKEEAKPAKKAKKAKKAKAVKKDAAPVDAAAPAAK